MVDLTWRWLRWWHVQHTAGYTGGVDNALLVPLAERITWLRFRPSAGFPRLIDNVAPVRLAERTIMYWLCWQNGVDCTGDTDEVAVMAAFHGADDMAQTTWRERRGDSRERPNADSKTSSD